VKNAEGSDSPATTRRDQTRKYARWLEAAGVVVPRGPGGEPAHAIEIDPLFALDAAELKGRLPRGFSVSGPVLLR
jgi:UDP-N-acetylglucosamine/UDP-N-acetylgalactosamine diphosphorylase